MRCQPTQNIYKTARLGAEKSRLDASFELHIANSTLARYEMDEVVPSPDVVDAMAVLYAARDLTAVYCSEICPIGIKYAYQVEQKDLPVSVLGLLKDDTDFHKLKDRLIEIASDGDVTPDEVQEFRGIVNELMDIEQRIEDIKLWAARAGVLPVDQMIQERKEKAASKAAI